MTPDEARARAVVSEGENAWEMMRQAFPSSLLQRSIVLLIAAVRAEERERYAKREAQQARRAGEET